MSIKIGDKLPEVSVSVMGEEGPEQVSITNLVSDKKVIIFAVPGAFTPTCHSSHMPSFIRVMDDLKAKGVDAVMAIAVNDPFVMSAWGEATGADAAGITLLADAEAAFTKAIGMDFNAPPVGLIDRSKRYAMLVENGVVTQLNEEKNPGLCDVSSGEEMLSLL